MDSLIIHRALPECGVCLQQFDADAHAPHVAPCGHTVCALCLLQELCRCPFDQTEIVASQCPRNFTLLHMVNVQNTERRATVRCLDCGEVMCAEVGRWHTQAKVLRHHRVVPITDNASEVLLCCPEHSGQLWTFFCVPCQQLMCAQCALLNHAGHERQGVQEASDAARTTLDTAAQEATAHLKNTKRQIVTVDRALAGLRQNSQHVERGLAELQSQVLNVLFCIIWDACF